MVVNFSVTNVSHSLILIICLQADFSLESHDNLRDNIVHLAHCTMISVFRKVKKKKVIPMSIPKVSFKSIILRGLWKLCFTAIKRLKSKHENAIDCNMIQK